MQKIIFDLETIPDQNLPEGLIPVYEPDKRLKDPLKIEEHRKSFDEDLVKKLSVNPMTCQIVSLQIKQPKDPLFIETGKDEPEMLALFWHAAADSQQLIGHNILGFDLPVIFIRSMVLGVLPTRKLKLQKYRSSPIFDTMHLLGNWTSFISLDKALLRFGLDGKSGHGSQVYPMWLAGKIDEIHQYCQDDVLATERLYNRMQNFY